jgi:hypothetical protein
MPNYLISYDLRRVRNYEPLWKQLRDWGAVRLLESLWLAELRGPSDTVRQLLTNYIDSDDGLTVISLEAGTNWSTIRCQPAGVSWLKAHFP